MGGFSRIYGITGTFRDNSESVALIYVQILVGEGHRQWYEAHYFDKSIKPIGKIRSMVPIGPNDENSLLDACIAFAPKFFESCPTLKKIKEELKDSEVLGFDSDKDKIPKEWKQLRREAAPIFEKLNISKIKLIPLSTEQRYLDTENKNDLKDLR